MIDIHSHILPGVDDGPSSIEESISMIKIAIQEGITHIIATPHYKPPVFENMIVLDAYNNLIKAIEKEKLKIKISLGNELYLSEDTLKLLETGSCMTLGNSKYVLVELPYNKIYPIHERMLYELQLNGYKVILAHIERYKFFMNDIQLLRRIITSGCHTQINAMTIVGTSTRKMTLNLIADGLIHLIATDCHSIKNRAPRISNAYTIVQTKIGTKTADDLFCNNGNYILNNQPLTKEWTAENTQKTWLNKLQTRWRNLR